MRRLKCDKECLADEIGYVIRVGAAPYRVSGYGLYVPTEERGV
jgi:hypothetical protein